MLSIMNSQSFLTERQPSLAEDLGRAVPHNKGQTKKKNQNASRPIWDTPVEQTETRTEQAKQRSKKAIRASELSYRRLFEAAKDGIPILEGATGRTRGV